MIHLYVFIIAFLVENPRIIHDTLKNNIEKNEISESNITLRGEKTFSLSGIGRDKDIFQSTNIKIMGKTKNGWEIEGNLFDDKIKPENDIYTVGLSDVNTAYLIIHRKTDSVILGRFSLHGTGIDGAYLRCKKGHFIFKGGGGKTRGITGIFDTTLSLPYNLPILITLKNVDYFTIVEGSERVFIDGRRLQKGEYSLDPQRRILKLHIKENPPHIHLRVEFEYHSVMESPFIHSVDFGYSYKKLNANIKWYSEDLSKIPIFDTLGGVYLREGGGDYEKKDSVFIYVGEGKGHYRVYFKQDTIGGSYIYDERGFYVFVGKGKGNYSPITLKNLPKLIDVKQGDIKLGDKIYTRISYISTQNKITHKRGESGEVALGFIKDGIEIETGMKKVRGTPILIRGYYDFARNRYIDTPDNEKFLTLRIRKPKWNLHYLFSYTKKPNWYLKSKLLWFYLISQGDRKLNNITLKYIFEKGAFSIFKTHERNEGVYGKIDIFKNTSLSAIFMKDSLNSKHHNLTFLHENSNQSSQIKMLFSKQDNYFLYDISSSLFFNDFNISLSMKRNLDFQSVFIPRYIKTDYGEFEYDSTRGEMIPSEFGRYIRVITEGQSESVGYVNTYETNTGLHGKSWNMGFYLSYQKANSCKKNSFNLNFYHNALSGSLLSISYETSRYMTEEDSKANGQNGMLKLSFYGKRIVNPFVFSKFWKDPFSFIERAEKGIGSNIKSKKFKTKIQLSKTRNSLIKDRYYTIEGTTNFKILNIECYVSFEYPTSKSKSPLTEKYISMSIKREFPFGDFKNQFNFEVFIIPHEDARWRVETTLLF